MTGNALTSRLSYSRAVRVARLCGLATGVVGVAALVSWAFGFQEVASSGLLPNAAAAFLLGGLAVVFLQPLRSRAVQAIGIWLAAAVALLGVATLGQDALGLDGGLDRVLWPTRLAYDESVPIRMPAAVSLSLVLLGGALLLTRSRKSVAHAWSECLALVVFALAMVVLAGHLYRVEGLYFLGGSSPVGVPAGIALALFATATLFTSPALGIARRVTEDSAGGLALRRLLPAALIVPALIGLATQLVVRDRALDDVVVAVYSVAVALVFMAAVLWTDAAMRAVEAQRSEAEKRFRRTFENATVGIAHVAPDGRWLRVNQRLCDMVGRPREELEQLRFAELVHPQDRDRHEEQEARLRGGEISTTQGIERLLDAEGSTLWAEVRASPQLDDRGRLDYLIYVLLDVSDRVRAQAERERLLQEALHARSEAERANRAKDEFFALVSHELRAPLNTITSWLSVLRGAGDETLRERALRNVERAVRTQTRLINDLLDASRIQSGKLELASELFDARAAIATTVEAVLPVASAKNVRLAARLGDQPLAVRGDEERIQQVVRNLVDNAIKFTPAGGTVQVALQRRGESLRLEVHDDGAGIDPAELPLVFERFRQGRSGTGHGGLGLGLAIVSYIVEQHGGEVTAESDGPGRGSTFRLTLPLARAAEAALLTSQQPQRVQRAAALDLGGVDVLIVDNDRGTLDALQLLVQNAGATVRVASSVEDALAAIAERRPDAVLSDVYMPGRTGVSLAQALRRQEAAGAPRVFALAMTSESGRTTRERLLESGFDDYLAKPIDAEQLLGRVSLGAGSGGEAATAGNGAQRVLLVEDDDAALEAIAALLADDSRRVLAASSGREALEKASAESPDLLITDYELPDMTGAELVTLLRRHAGRDVPAVALTGHARADLGDDADVFARVLRKPVSVAELEGALRLLEGTPPASQPAGG